MEIKKEDLQFDDVSDLSHSYKVVYQDSKFKVVKPKSQESFVYGLAVGTPWCRSWGWGQEEEEENSVNSYWGREWDKCYVLFDKANNNKYLVVKGSSYFYDIDGKGRPFAKWLMKNGTDKLITWFYQENFPYIANTLSKKASDRLKINAGTVFHYPEDCKKYKSAIRGIFTSVEFKEGTKKIANNGLRGLFSVESITIPDTVTSIGDNAFCGCKKLNNVVIPDSVTNLGHSCFYGCESLNNITLPDTLKLSYYTFGFCGFEELPKIPTATTELYALFYGCKKLKKVVIPSHVKCIEWGCFASCPALEEIYIPNTVRTIAGSVFCGWSGETPTNPNLQIYCEAASKPRNWRPGWNVKPNIPWNMRQLEENHYSVHWGATMPAVNEALEITNVLNNPIKILYNDDEFTVFDKVKLAEEDPDFDDLDDANVPLLLASLNCSKAQAKAIKTMGRECGVFYDCYWLVNKLTKRIYPFYRNRGYGYIDFLKLLSTDDAGYDYFNDDGEFLYKSFSEGLLRWLLNKWKNGRNMVLCKKELKRRGLSITEDLEFSDVEEIGCGVLTEEQKDKLVDFLSSLEELVETDIDRCQWIADHWMYNVWFERPSYDGPKVFGLAKAMVNETLAAVCDNFKYIKLNQWAETDYNGGMNYIIVAYNSAEEIMRYIDGGNGSVYGSYPYLNSICVSTDFVKEVLGISDPHQVIQESIDKEILNDPSLTNDEKLGKNLKEALEFDDTDDINLPSDEELLQCMDTTMSFLWDIENYGEHSREEMDALNKRCETAILKLVRDYALDEIWSVINEDEDRYIIKNCDFLTAWDTLDKCWDDDVSASLEVTIRNLNTDLNSVELNINSLDKVLIFTTSGRHYIPGLGCM